MMNVPINGQMCKVPPCTCGKCIVRRLRKNFFSSFPYNKNLASTYSNDYDWKTNDENPDDLYNRSKHTGFEGVYKEHIPTSLISTMKMDYKPFKVQIEKPIEEKKEPFRIPFMARSTYKTVYPNWGAMVPVADNSEKLPEIIVPLRGQSNYTENYPRHDPKFYQRGDPLNFAKPTLKFYGNLNPQTTHRDDFRPVDFGNTHYFPKDPLINTAKGENTVFIPADFPPNNFESSYSNNYVAYQDKMCRLRQWLNSRGMRFLEI